MTVDLYQPTVAFNFNPNYFSNRSEKRVSLILPIFVRRASHSSEYRKRVYTKNVSANGFNLILNVPLEIGAELVITAFQDFSAVAIVRHSTKRADGKWSIGLEFTKKEGQWVIA